MSSPSSQDAADPANRFDEDSFRKKLSRFARQAGEGVISKALVLYYCLKDPDTPAWARRIIVGALAYFVLPVDAIPDIVPFVGFGDDLGVLIGAVAMVLTHIKPQHRAQADRKIREWIGRGPA
jgi:uncharacterized membrane protein YkvA (DUF1232 family)